MKSTVSESTKTLFVSAAAGDALPDALLSVLRAESISRAFVRGTGVVSDVELQTLGEGGALVPRQFGGPLQLVSLDGSISEDGALLLSAVLSREANGGLEIVAGALTRARVMTFDGVVLGTKAVAVAQASPPPKPAPVVTFENPQTPRPMPAQPQLPAAIVPQKPVRAVVVEEDAPFPEAGDLVDHFAFGACEVVKSDGDRIHLRISKDKDARIKEIALAMLKVTPLDLSSAPRLFKLDRKV